MPGDAKRSAAEAAVAAEVASGMRLGLGTGSTAVHVVHAIARRLDAGELDRIVGVPTSEATAALARSLGVPLASLAEEPELDVAIDGADEIDPRLDLVKGLGGALLREKVVASAARRFVVVADDSKPVERLGTRAPVPVEVIPFAEAVCRRALAALGSRPVLRAGADGAPFVTDEQNVILDCWFDGGLADAGTIAGDIAGIPGVVGHGLFLGMAAVAYVGGRAGVTVLGRPGT